MHDESNDGAAPVPGAAPEMAGALAPPDGSAASAAGSGTTDGKAAPGGRERLVSPVLRIFLAAMILANVGGMAFFPLMPLYLKELNAGVSEIGLFFTLSMIAPLAMQIFGGWASDRLGRLKSIAIGSVAGAIGWVGVILAPNWGWLLAGQAIGAIAGAFVAPSFDAFIAEQSSEKNRAKVFGISQTVFQVVSVVGPLAGGLMVKAVGWKGLIWSAAATYWMATAIRLWLARKHPPAATASGKLSMGDFGRSFMTMAKLAVAGGVITWLIISDGVRDISMGLSGNLLPIFLQDHRGIDVAAIGLLNALFGGASMLVMIPAGHLADRFGERFAIAGGYLTAFFAFALMLLVPTPWAAGASFIVFGLAIGMLSPAYQSLISKSVPENLRGIAYGFLSTSNGFVALPAPWLGAMLWKGVGPTAPFWVTTMAMLLIVPPVLAKFKPPKQEAS